MDKTIISNKEDKNNVKLSEVYKCIEKVDIDLGKIIAATSVVSKAGGNVSGYDAVKLCNDISSSLDVLISKMSEKQEELEKSMFIMEDLLI